MKGPVVFITISDGGINNIQTEGLPENVRFVEVNFDDDPADYPNDHFNYVPPQDPADPDNQGDGFGACVYEREFWSSGGRNWTRAALKFLDEKTPEGVPPEFNEKEKE